MPPKKAHINANKAIGVRPGKNLYQPDPPAAIPGVHTLLKPVIVVANPAFQLKLKDLNQLGRCDACHRFVRRGDGVFHREPR